MSILTDYHSHTAVVPRVDCSSMIKFCLKEQSDVGLQFASLSASFGQITTCKKHFQILAL